MIVEIKLDSTVDNCELIAKMTSLLINNANKDTEDWKQIINLPPMKDCPF